MRLQSYAKFFNHQTFPNYFLSFLQIFLPTTKIRHSHPSQFTATATREITLPPHRLGLLVPCRGFSLATSLLHPTRRSTASASWSRAGALASPPRYFIPPAARQTNNPTARAFFLYEFRRKALPLQCVSAQRIYRSDVVPASTALTHYYITLLSMINYCKVTPGTAFFIF